MKRLFHSFLNWLWPLCVNHTDCGNRRQWGELCSECLGRKFALDERKEKAEERARLKETLKPIVREILSELK